MLVELRVFDVYEGKRLDMGTVMVELRPLGINQRELLEAMGLSDDGEMRCRVEEGRIIVEDSKDGTRYFEVVGA